MSRDEEEITEAQKRAAELVDDIVKACVKYKLNLTIYNGRIGVVDQEQMKIVALWTPSYTTEENEHGKD